jgi:hypothetical protein
VSCVVDFVEEDIAECFEVHLVEAKVCGSNSCEFSYGWAARDVACSISAMRSWVSSRPMLRRTKVAAVVAIGADCKVVGSSKALAPNAIADLNSCEFSYVVAGSR